jgi:hypothetical protein
MMRVRLKDSQKIRAEGKNPQTYLDEVYAWLEEMIPNPPLPEEQNFTFLNGETYLGSIEFKDDDYATLFALKYGY